MKLQKILLLIGTIIFTGFPVFSSPYTSEYGTCANIINLGLKNADQLFQAMKNAGIRMARMDFKWDLIEKQQGQWSFEHLDHIVAQSKTSGVGLLPILNYDVKWASPAYKHLDQWCEYVRKVVTRYKNDLPFWEVYNEPNLAGFWKDEVNAANYVKLLKATYKTIKSIDPDLVVVHAGLCGVPMQYLEEEFKAGAGKYFDVMNIHPYRDFPGGPESPAPSLMEQIVQLRLLMKRYGIENKPLWISEMGWSTQRNDEARYREILPVMLDAAKIPPHSTVAFICDLAYRMIPTFKPENVLPEAKSLRIRYNEIQNLNPQKVPVLIASYYAESFPMKFFDDLERYIRNGGMVILPAGAPLYYDLQLQSDGQTLRRIGGQDKYRKRLHLELETPWSIHKAPANARIVEISPAYTGKLSVGGPSQLFLGKGALQAGDKLTSIIQLRQKNDSRPVMGVYHYNSDLKGHLGIFTYRPWSTGATEEEQAQFLVRSMLISAAMNVEKFFWYEFRGSETLPDDKESHFGLLHSTLAPKPAYNAYKVLTRMRPEGSTRPSVYIDEHNIWHASWKRPDGTAVTALWSVGLDTPIRAAVSTNLENFQQGINATPRRCHVSLPASSAPVSLYDINGKPVAFQNEIVEVSPSVVYLTGTENVTIRKVTH